MKIESLFGITSALLPLCCAQSGPAIRSRSLFRRFAKPVVWWATPVEIRSALARLRQNGDLPEREVNDAVKKWEMLERIVREVNPTEQVRHLACGVPEQYLLRALDAFQLAAALAWCQGRPRRRPSVSFDDHLARAAGSAGFTVHGLES